MRESGSLEKTTQQQQRVEEAAYFLSYHEKLYFLLPSASLIIIAITESNEQRAERSVILVQRGHLFITKEFKLKQNN
jgi:hypothetical protein